MTSNQIHRVGLVGEGGRRFLRVMALRGAVGVRKFLAFQGTGASQERESPRVEFEGHRGNTLPTHGYGMGRTVLAPICPLQPIADEDERCPVVGMAVAGEGVRP
jgi:hypothetical protein